MSKLNKIFCIIIILFTIYCLITLGSLGFHLIIEISDELGYSDIGMIINGATFVFIYGLLSFILLSMIASIWCKTDER